METTTVLPNILLSPEELETILTALAYARDGKLKERENTAPEPETRILYDGDALPPVGSLDGDILRIGALLLKLQSEASCADQKSQRGINHADSTS